MTNKKILVIGGSGLLGIKLREVLEENNCDVHATFYQNQIKKGNCFRLDITHKNDVENALDKVSPDIIVHTAAYTNVDECEKNKDVAFAVNVQGTKNLANTAEKLGAKFIYISTDYVFDGKKGFYKEDDQVNPIDFYGETKLLGEKAVGDICNDFIIARTSVLYGANKNNFVTWLIENLKSGKNINIVNDQFVSPTLNTDLSHQIIELIQADETGIYHTAGGERINRYNFALFLADVFSLDKNLINEVSVEDMSWIAHRPKDSSLNISKISKFKKPYKVREALNLLRKEVRG